MIYETLEGTKLTSEHDTSKHSKYPCLVRRVLDNGQRSILVRGAQEDIDRDLLEAFVYYGNLAELPYTLDIDVNELAFEPYYAAIIDAFSRARMLKPGMRAQRQALCDAHKHLMHDRKAWREALLGVKSALPAPVDAADIELGGADE